MADAQRPHSVHAPDITRDPVCGMSVDPNAGKPTATHEGHTFHFCSQGCHDKFVGDPEAYRTAVDPVCGMTVERATTPFMSKHDGLSLIHI